MRSQPPVAAKSRKCKGSLLIGINLGVAAGCNRRAELVTRF
jgi:hypothetical protein